MKVVGCYYLDNLTDFDAKCNDVDALSLLTYVAKRHPYASDLGQCNDIFTCGNNDLSHIKQ